MLVAIKRQYKTDALFVKVMAKPGHYKAFSERRGLLYSKNRRGEEVLCVPQGVLEGKLLRGASGGPFWPATHGRLYTAMVLVASIVANMEEFCRTCHTCLMTKDSKQ